MCIFKMNIAPSILGSVQLSSTFTVSQNFQLLLTAACLPCPQRVMGKAPAVLSRCQALQFGGCPGCPRVTFPQTPPQATTLLLQEHYISSYSPIRISLLGQEVYLLVGLSLLSSYFAPFQHFECGLTPFQFMSLAPLSF